MIDPADFLRVVIKPGCIGLSRVMGREIGDAKASVMLLAIALQESGLEYRRQIDANGEPIETLARGWWQFEKGGGVAGVCNHTASAEHAVAVCDKLHVPFDVDTIHDAIAWNDWLSLAFARLLLYTDAAPLPQVGDEDPAWDYYIRNWRPGAPHRDRWSVVYPDAVRTVLAGGV